MTKSEAVPLVIPVEELSSHVLPVGETGAEELRRAVRVLAECSESCLDGFTAEQLLKLCRACWASGWDVWPDNLSDNQAAAAIEHGEVPCFFESSRGLVGLPALEARVAIREGDAFAAEHDWLFHRGRGDSRDELAPCPIEGCVTNDSNELDGDAAERWAALVALEAADLSAWNERLEKENGR